MKNVAKKKHIEREWKRNKQEGMVCPVNGERGGWALTTREQRHAGDKVGHFRLKEP